MPIDQHFALALVTTIDFAVFLVPDVLSFWTLFAKRDSYAAFFAILCSLFTFLTKGLVFLFSSFFVFHCCQVSDTATSHFYFMQCSQTSAAGAINLAPLSLLCVYFVQILTWQSFLFFCMFFYFFDLYATDSRDKTEFGFALLSYNMFRVFLRFLWHAVANF